MQYQARPVPRGEKRRDQISDVAECVFFERGYAETTMQLIAERAGASKETLYRHFGCKEALFSEVVRRRSARLTGNEDERTGMGPPKQALLDLALRLLRDLGEADPALCLYRVVVAESPREPELGRIFYAQGPGRIIARLSDYLTLAAERHELQVADADLAAKLFIGAVMAHHHILRLVAEATFSEAELRTHAMEAVSLFLARYGA